MSRTHLFLTEDTHRHVGRNMCVRGGVPDREMLVLVDSCQGCFGSSVWILCQTSLLSAVVDLCRGRALGGRCGSAAMRQALN